MFVVPVAAVIIRRRHSPALKARFPLGGTARARLSAVLIFLLIAILFGYAAIGLLPDWAYYLGLSLSLLGFAIWLWGQQILGRYWSIELVIYQGHQLVERGPYRFVRHPMYTGLILLWVGAGFTVQSWVAAVVIAIIAAIGSARGIPIEERVLVSEFGEQYVSYSRRVKRRLIPFIW